MAVTPPEQPGSWKELALFVVKVVAMLAGIFAFGAVVFWLRRSIH